jgi:hypothetical protein
MFSKPVPTSFSIQTYCLYSPIYLEMFPPFLVFKQSIGIHLLHSNFLLFHSLLQLLKTSLKYFLIYFSSTMTYFKYQVRVFTSLLDNVQVSRNFVLSQFLDLTQTEKSLEFHTLKQKTCILHKHFCAKL